MSAPHPNDWVIVDANGSRALCDFSELYKDKEDPFGRKFRDNVLESLSDLICESEEIVCMDVKLFERLIEMKREMFEGIVMKMTSK